MQQPANAELGDPVEGCLKAGDLEGALTHIRVRKQAVKRSLIASNGGHIVGIEAKHSCLARWGVVLVEMSGGGSFRVQYYDEDGFSGHSVYLTAEAALDGLIGSNCIVPDKGALHRIQITERWLCRVHA